jgi:hypothetical protein
VTIPLQLPLQAPLRKLHPRPSDRSAHLHWRRHQAGRWHNQRDYPLLHPDLGRPPAWLL